MAFTGTAVVERITERLYRVTGLSLAAAAAGTIGLLGGAGDVELPGTDDWNAMGAATLIDSVQVTMVPVTAVATAIPVRVVKSGATNDLFVITLTNDHATVTTPELEIYIELR